jgi:hypothetical protein
VSIRVPNTELIVPDEYINKTTGQSATNDTVRNIVINPVQDINKNDLPLLGRLFLSSAYLSVNHDSGTFTLWQTDTAARKRALQALDEGNRVVTEYCTRDNGTNQPTDIPPLATATLTPEPSHGLSDGAIGGVVVGTITFIAFLGAVIFWFWRKKCGSKVAETAPQLDEWQKPRTSPSHSRLDVSVIPLELPTSYINSNKTFRVSIHQCI